MRVVPLVIVVLPLFLTSAQEEKTMNRQPGEQRMPTTLSEAHAELERVLPPEELAKIDAMPSEGGMIEYHFGLGADIRNRWGLWRGSPLAKHMQGLGFTHPDNMSGVILATFWCKRHGQDFRLRERAAGYRRALGIEDEATEEELTRVKKAKAALPNMTMGLQFEKRDVPTVCMPDAGWDSLDARFLSAFRGGVFLTVYVPGRERIDADIFTTRGVYFDAADRKLHPIRVAEINDVQSAVVVGKRAWFAGNANGKAVLKGVNGQDRIVLPLPEAGPSPQLGIDDQSLLAVYPKAIFRLTDQTWALVRSVDFPLPHSGTPPQLYDRMVLFRDEGVSNGARRLWLLTLGDEPRLRSFDRDTGLRGPDEPIPFPDRHDRPIGGLYNSFSFCATKSGDLWVCVGTRDGRKSLFRRSRDGSYSIAITNNSVRFAEDSLGPAEADQDLSISGVAALPDETLLLVGNAGLYRLRGKQLVQELAFTNTQQKIRGISTGRAYTWYWNPSIILLLDDGSYFISGAFGGVYLLTKGNNGQWSFLPLDEKLGIPVVW
jgi:hypothetical protein